MNAETPNPDAVVHYRGNDSCMTEDNAGYLIKLVSSSLNRMLDQEMAPLDLTAMQWRPSPCCIAAAPTRPPSWRA